MSQTTASPTPIAPPAPRRARRWLRNLVILLSVFVGLPVAYYAFLQWKVGREWAQIVAEIDAVDPRWRLEDIAADRKQVPDERNSAILVKDIFRLRGTRVSSLQKHHELFNSLRNPYELHVRHVEVLREEFEMTPAEALAKARSLKELPDGHFSMTYPPNYFMTTPWEPSKCSSVIDLLYADALRRAQEGDLDGAVASCTALLNAARSLGDEPYTQYAYRFSGHSGYYWYTGLTKRILSQGQPSEAALVALEEQHAREIDELPHVWRQWLRGMRAGTYRLYEALQQREMDFSHLGPTSPQKDRWLARLVVIAPGFVTADLPHVLRFWHKAVLVNELPLERQLETIESLEKECEGHMRLFPIRCAGAWQSYLEYQARLRCSMLTVACERFRRRENRWPDALDELVKHHLIKEVPADPYDGRPLRYKRLPDGAVIYSIHWTTRQVYAYDRDDAQEFGFHLWDVSKRRQPPEFIPPHW